MPNKFINKIKTIFSKYALTAVIQAESLLGDKNGEAKKQLAIDFIISNLPVYLMPIKGVLRILLSDVLDSLIEKAVDKLHKIQQNIPEGLAVGA